MDKVREIQGRISQMHDRENEGLNMNCAAKKLSLIQFSFNALFRAHRNDEYTPSWNVQIARTMYRTSKVRAVMSMEDLIGCRKTKLKQNLFMFDRDSSIVPILGNYDLPKTLQAR